MEIPKADVVQLTVEELAALYHLDGVKGFGPQKFKELHEAGIPVVEVIKDPVLLPTRGKRGDQLRTQLHQLSSSPDELLRRAEQQLATATKRGAHILTYRDPRYPALLYRSNYPVPILYATGGIGVLQNQRTVACVGSRDIQRTYAALHQEFAAEAVSMGFTIVSGFAVGADSIGHRVAHMQGGATMCCMPGGLDRPFPPENRAIWREFLSYQGAVMVSESPFGVSASSLTLRRRNKLIVGLSLGVLVSQSSRTGGAMNAYRFGLEQKKPVATFAGDGTPTTSGNDEITNGGGRVFSSSAADRASYHQWLTELSSLI